MHPESAVDTAYSKAGLILLSALFFLVLAIYGLTLPRSITLEDAGLFQMVCHLDGLAHPPGYPLFTMLCRPLVIGLDLLTANPVVSGNLISAVFAALAVVIFCHCCYLLSHNWRLSALAAVAWAFSPVFWSQAIIIEVYSLAAMNFMVCFWMIIRFTQTGSRKWWYAGALAFGISLSNHWPLMLVSTPALVAIAWQKLPRLLIWARDFRFWIMTVLAFALGLVPYITMLHVPNPTISVTGSILSFNDFIQYVTRHAYSGLHVGSTLSDKTQYVSWLIGESFRQAGYLGIPFVFAGLCLSLTRFAKEIAASMVLLLLGATVLLPLLVNFSYENLQRATFLPYTLIAMAAPSFWLAQGLDAVIDQLGKFSAVFRYMVGHALTLLIVGAIALTNYPIMNRSDSNIASSFNRAVLHSLPTNAVLFAKSDDQIGPLGYLNLVEKVRPDVTLMSWDQTVFSNRLGSPWLPQRERDKLILAYIAAGERPIASIDPILHPRTDYGAYILTANTNSHVISPAFMAWLDYALTLHSHQFIRHAHEKVFIEQKFWHFSRLLNEVQGSTTPEINSIKTRLAQTFPGKLAALEILTNQSNSRKQDERMRLIAEIERDINKTHHSGLQGLFFNLAARTHREQRANRNKVKNYFTRSIKVYGNPNNGSICELMQMLKESDDKEEIEELAVLNERFPELSCER